MTSVCIFCSGLSSFEKSGHSRQDNISTFLKWFHENGGKAEHVVIDDFGEQGLGLKAVCDIKVLIMADYIIIEKQNILYRS